MQFYMRAKSFTWLACLVIAVGSITLQGCSAHANGWNKAVLVRSRVATSSVDPQECNNTLEDVQGEIDYDPWVSFNEKTFWFNHDVLDRYLLKPIATAWQYAIPQLVRQGLVNAFYNLDAPGRLVNNLLQARFNGSSRVAAGFLINSTIGVAGFIDISSWAGMRRSDADTGQTLGTYGIGPGPYLVLPFLHPLTVRDGIGYGVDSLLDPLDYLIPWTANLGQTTANTVNDRAANLQLFEDVEEISLDLYAAVRNGYLQRRERSIERAIAEREGQEGTGKMLGTRTVGGSGGCTDAEHSATRIQSTPAVGR